MKLLKLGFCIFILCIFINNSMAQNIELFHPSREIIETGFDNRSLAMGKTTTITSRSSSAIFSNPSILATFSQLQVQAGGKLFYGTVTDESLNRDDSGSYEYGYPIALNRSYFAVAVPYQFPNSELKLVFGAGYQRNEGTRWELETTSLEQEGSETLGELVDISVSSGINGSRRGDLSTITPGIALDFQDKYYLGLTVNRTLGAIISKSELIFADSRTEIDVEREQSAQFLRLGALAKFTPELSIGLMFRPEFDWEFGETITKTIEDGELDTDRDQTDVELTMPTMWGIGAEYKVSPEFIVALEIQSRPFSDFELIGIPLSVIDNGYNFAVGAEYLGAGLPLRFGAFRDVIPDVDANDTAPIGLIGITGGIGSNNDKEFSWDASAVYGTWERANAEGQKYSENLFHANISITYRFNTVLGTASTE